MYFLYLENESKQNVPSANPGLLRKSFHTNQGKKERKAGKLHQNCHAWHHLDVK